MTNQDLTIEDAMQRLFANMTDTISTAIPAFVESYDPKTQLADVTIPFVDFLQTDEGIEREEYDTLPDVPVMYPRFGGMAIHAPLERGDLVFLVVCQRSLDEWYISDGKTTVSPSDLRSLDMSDAVAFPVGHTEKNNLPESFFDSNNMTIGNETTNVTIKPDGEVVINTTKLKIGDDTANAALALATETKANFDAFKTSFDTHTHGGVLIGGSFTAPPLVGHPTPQDVNSGVAFTND